MNTKDKDYKYFKKYINMRDFKRLKIENVRLRSSLYLEQYKNQYVSREIKHFNTKLKFDYLDRRLFYNYYNPKIYNFYRPGATEYQLGYYRALRDVKRDVATGKFFRYLIIDYKEIEKRFIESYEKNKRI